MRLPSPSETAAQRPTEALWSLFPFTDGESAKKKFLYYLVIWE